MFEKIANPNVLIGLVIAAVFIIATKALFFPSEESSPINVPGNGEIVTVYGDPDELEDEFGPEDERIAAT